MTDIADRKMDEKPKPCPFCGTMPIIEKKPLSYGFDGYYINCYKYDIHCPCCECRLRIEENDTICRSDEEAKANAVKAWNTRANEKSD